MKSLSKQLGLEKSVTFHGRQPLETISKLSIKSRAFVQHSITAQNGDKEGTPVAILEAASLGLPIISTQHGGINDAVIHGSTGFLVKEKDVETMAKYMLELARKPILAKDMGLRGYQHIQEHYNQEKLIQQLWELIETAMQS
jgi:glycosyltransferase involved in cell wall biosynthesis